MRANEGARLKDVQHSVIRNLLGTRCLGKCGFTIDANANDAEIDTAVSYMINGVLYTLGTDAALDISADVTNLAEITVAPLPTGYTQIFVFEVDAAGAYTVAAGKQVANADITAGTALADWPSLTSEIVCPFGAIKIVNTSVGDFILGTTLMDVAGITETFYDIGVVPNDF
jgi:hypothetical protein